MMTLEQFNQRVATVAAGRAYSIRFECTTYSDNHRNIAWSVWLDGLGWTRDYPSPESALEYVEKPAGTIPEMGNL